MPNGGSDCCGTCWFNRKNQGERDWLLYVDTSVSPYCEIRDIAIKDPFYTYCANHPHRRPDRDPIPIGPVMRHGGWEEERRVQAGQPDVLVSKENPRYVWKPSPDSEEIRQHLLNLLESIFEHMSRDWYPIGDGLGETVIRQLGEFNIDLFFLRLGFSDDGFCAPLNHPHAPLQEFIPYNDIPDLFGEILGRLGLRLAKTAIVARYETSPFSKTFAASMPRIPLFTSTKAILSQYVLPLSAAT